MTAFIIILALLLAGCGAPAAQAPTPSPTAATTPDPAETPEATPEPDPASEAFKAVLQGNAGFFSVDAGEKLVLDELHRAVGSDESVSVESPQFAAADLDSDGIPEIVLSLTVDGNEYYGCEVLRFSEGVVYGYTLWYRAFNELKQDGTFSFSAGAADSGYGVLQFSDDAFALDRISYSESSSDADGGMTVSYFVDRESASEEEFSAALDRQSEKPGVEWLEFSAENIATLETILNSAIEKAGV